MADAVANGKSIGEVANIFQVTLKSVREACHEFNVALPSRVVPTEHGTASTVAA